MNAPSGSAAASAHPNIALIKYWGNRDPLLRLPSNSSISMNLAGLATRTRVSFDARLTADVLELNGQVVEGAARTRVSAFLDHVRRLSGLDCPARVESSNDFPAGAGVASSASAFAALALAASLAAGLDLDEAALSRLARRGSGSACRSIPGGFVEWSAGSEDLDSFARTIAPPEHWQLVDCIAVVDLSEKPTGSTEGHALAGTSPLQAARVADAPRRLALCRQALLERDFAALAEVVESDSNLMHAVMMTSSPPLFYWQPATLRVLTAVRAARRDGLPACSTVDAGPNVHVLGPGSAGEAIRRLLTGLEGVREVLVSGVGTAARRIPWEEGPS